MNSIEFQDIPSEIKKKIELLRVEKISGFEFRSSPAPDEPPSLDRHELLHACVSCGLPESESTRIFDFINRPVLSHCSILSSTFQSYWGGPCSGLSMRIGLIVREYVSTTDTLAILIDTVGTGYHHLSDLLESIKYYRIYNLAQFICTVRILYYKLRDSFAAKDDLKQPMVLVIIDSVSGLIRHYHDSDREEVILLIGEVLLRLSMLHPKIHVIIKNDSTTQIVNEIEEKIPCLGLVWKRITNSSIFFNEKTNGILNK